MEMGTIDNQASLALLQSQQSDRTMDAAKRYQNARDEKNLDEIKQAAQEFESVFIYEMMKPMFEGLDVDPLFGGGKGEEIFRGFLLQEYGKGIAQTGGLGLQDSVMSALLKAQETANTQ